MKNGIINLNSEFAKEIGFTKDKFLDDSYLWKDKDTIIVSQISSTQEGKGHLKQLFKNISNKGFSIKVPTPSVRMKYLCLKWGFENKFEWFPEPYNCEGEIMFKK